MASGSFDQKIIIWDTIKGISLQTLTGHTNWVAGLVVLKNSNLVSCSGDQIKVWNVTNGALIRSNFMAVYNTNCVLP